MSRTKRRYVIVRCTDCKASPESVAASVAEAIERAFGVVGLSYVDPQLVEVQRGSMYIFSVNREGVDKLLASLVISAVSGGISLEVVKVTGSLRKARRVVSSLAHE